MDSGKRYEDSELQKPQNDRDWKRWIPTEVYTAQRSRNDWNSGQDFSASSYETPLEMTETKKQ